MPTDIKITIGGMTFDVTLPYETGTPMGEVEADILNQNWLRRLRNGFATKIKDQPALGPETQAGLKAMFREFCSELTLVQPKWSDKDPTYEEAISLAKSVLIAQLNEKGEDPDKIPEPKLRSAAAALLLKRPDLLQAARERMADTDRAARDMLSELGLD